MYIFPLESLNYIYEADLYETFQRSFVSMHSTKLKKTYHYCKSCDFHEDGLDLLGILNLTR